MAQQIVIEVPGTKISELEPTSSVSPLDEMPVVQGNETKKAPLEQVAELVKSGLGTAAMRDVSEFATPAAVSDSSQASQVRDDAINERVDDVEFAVASMANRKVAAFRTYALADSVKNSLPANSIIVVTRDPDPTKNGDYDWDGITLEKSDYDPASQSIEFTEIFVGKRVDILSDPIHTHILVDLNQKRMFAVQKDGGLKATGLDGTIQEEIIAAMTTAVRADANLESRATVVSDPIHTHILVDLNQKRMFAVQKDGGLKATGLDGTIQEEITAAMTTASRADSNLENRATILGDAVHTHVLCDLNQKRMFAIQKDGGVKFVGFEQTLQEILADLYGKTEVGSVTTDTNLASIRTQRDVFTSETQEAINMQRFANINAAPAPLDLHARKYSISDTWLDQIRFSKPASKTVINTPYRNNDGVVHPHLIEFYNGFRGYRYLLKVEPYYNTLEQYENPCIYGSHDLVNFELLDGFTQPLADRPVSPHGTAHNSDGVFAYDPRTGDLILVWRESWRNWNNTGETYDAWAMRKTKDGYTWTDKEYLLEPVANGTGFNTAAPAILYDPKKDEWHVYIGTGNSMQHYVKKTLTKGGWELPETIVTPAGFNPWHVDVRFVGEKVVALVHDNYGGQIRFGISSDFVNFKWATASNYMSTAGSLDMYKATFRPKFNELDQLAFDVIFTTRFDSENVEDRWNLLVTETNYVDALEI